MFQGSVNKLDMILRTLIHSRLIIDYLLLLHLFENTWYYQLQQQLRACKEDLIHPRQQGRECIKIWLWKKCSIVVISSILPLLYSRIRAAILEKSVSDISFQRLRVRRQDLFVEEATSARTTWSSPWLFGLKKKKKKERKKEKEEEEGTARNDKRNGVINKTETQRHIKRAVCLAARIHPFNAAIYPAIK